ncbi:hypothetical protein [Sinomicrobium oceani]|uniref:hypothetical protein n=1 Tax=Sinomicrobium oceani TaxID=1150368 RepID=UPI002279F789|nr:hypothetical protein [Sinomicrobium oceani]
MSIKNLREKITTANHPKWFNQALSSIDYNHLGIKEDFSGVLAAYQYFLDQVAGWQKISGLPLYLKKSLDNFEGNILAIEKFIESNLQSDVPRLEGNWNRIKQNFIPAKQHSQYCVFPYDCPETVFLLDVNRRDPVSFQGAIDFITGNGLRQQTKPYVEGWIFSYEFIHKEDTALL